MRSTKVKALSVGGRRKIHYSGETVREDMFPKGRFDELIADGHLYPVGEGSDDGKKPKFEEDENGQPEVTFGKSKPQLAGMQNPTLGEQPKIETKVEDRPKPEQPKVPGTPGDVSVKVQNDETGKDTGTVKTESTKTEATKSEKDQSEKNEVTPITVAQLRKDLKERGVAHAPNATKEELFKLWANG